MVESTEQPIARQKREREAMRAQISKRKNETLTIPEPIVIHNESAVKGLKVLQDSKCLIIGLDTGDLKIIEKQRFALLS